jgi:hypothetical protein
MWRAHIFYPQDWLPPNPNPTPQPHDVFCYKTAQLNLCVGGYEGQCPWPDLTSDNKCSVISALATRNSACTVLLIDCQQTFTANSTGSLHLYLYPTTILILQFQDFTATHIGLWLLWVVARRNAVKIHRRFVTYCRSRHLGPITKKSRNVGEF